jgi:hypothetical protein
MIYQAEPHAFLLWDFAGWEDWCTAEPSRRDAYNWLRRTAEHGGFTVH